MQLKTFYIHTLRWDGRCSCHSLLNYFNEGFLCEYKLCSSIKCQQSLKTSLLTCCSFDKYKHNWFTPYYIPINTKDTLAFIHVSLSDYFMIVYLFISVFSFLCTMYRWKEKLFASSQSSFTTLYVLKSLLNQIFLHLLLATKHVKYVLLAFASHKNISCACLPHFHALINVAQCTWSFSYPVEFVAQTGLCTLLTKVHSLTSTAWRAKLNKNCCVGVVGHVLKQLACVVGFDFLTFGTFNLPFLLCNCFLAVSQTCLSLLT